tara:strand:+ start:3851 stop:4042 length:192 start_codon:yes stop_codon:yes gene_type:complete
MEDKNCLGCVYHWDKFCKYFEYSGKDKKRIPPEVFSKGCEFFEEKNELVHQIIEKFDGRFIDG